MARGGARPGSGRKEGVPSRPVLRNYYSPKEIAEYVKDLKEAAKTDANLKKFIGEQLFGKAVQPIGNDGDKPFAVAISGMEIIKG